MVRLNGINYGKEIMRGMLQGWQEPEEEVDKKNNMRKVYVLVNPDNHRVKIGITENIEQRLLSLKHASGSEIYVYYLSKWLYSATALEKNAHKHFQSRRYIGEWFNISPEEAAEYIKNNEDNYDVVSEKEIKTSTQNNTESNKTNVKEKQRKIQKARRNNMQVFLDEEECVLTEPISRFKPIGNNIYVRKNTLEKYHIRYFNKQWLVRRLPI